MKLHGAIALVSLAIRAYASEIDLKKNLPDLSEDTALYPVDLGPYEPAKVVPFDDQSCVDRLFRSPRTELAQVLSPWVALYQSIVLLAAIASFSMIMTFRFLHSELCDSNFNSGSFILVGMFIAGLIEGFISAVTLTEYHFERRSLSRVLERYPTHGNRNTLCLFMDMLSLLGSISGFSRLVAAMILFLSGSPCDWAQEPGFDHGPFITGFGFPAMLQIVSSFFILLIGFILDRNRS